jgi:response regulator RpfG family c-di-GMP phosphodiesterase
MNAPNTGHTASRLPRDLPRVLLVDDEVAILDALRRQLRRTFEVATATGGVEALEVMRSSAPFAAIVSDMRMPGMDGATFLAEARSEHPDTVRILLTGQADMQSAIAAINDGQIYRFLSKPCPTETLVDAISDGVTLYRQITAEKDVLERTLRTAVQSLVDVLSLANPTAFSRAVRVSQLVTDLCHLLGVHADWQIEVSGLLGQLGAVTLPTAVLDKIDAGLLLTDEEQEMVDAVPAVSEKLIGTIPRLEGLAAAIGQQRLRYDGQSSRPGAPVGDDLPLAARLLHFAVDVDTMRSQRLPVLAGLDRMRKDAGAYDPRILGAWERSIVGEGAAPEVVPVTVEFDELTPGMVLMEEVLSARGVVLLGRGSSVTEALLQRLRNHVKHSGLSGTIVVSSQRRADLDPV